MNDKILYILNDPPYGTERVFNGLRLATATAKHDDTQVRVFLMGDAVVSAMANQKLPDGYYHLDRMIATCARHGADIGCCGTCMDARGIVEDMLTKGTRRSTLDELAGRFAVARRRGVAGAHRRVRSRVRASST